MLHVAGPDHQGLGLGVGLGWGLLSPGRYLCGLEYSLDQLCAFGHTLPTSSLPESDLCLFLLVSSEGHWGGITEYKLDNSGDSPYQLNL